MAYQLNYSATSYTAAGDLSTVTGPVFISADATNRAIVSTASTIPLGILENAPPIGNICAVSYAGITKMTVAAAYPIGTFLVPNASGVGTSVGTDATCIYTYPYVKAVTLEDSTAANDIVAVRIVN